MGRSGSRGALLASSCFASSAFIDLILMKNIVPVAERHEGRQITQIDRGGIESGAKTAQGH